MSAERPGRPLRGPEVLWTPTPESRAASNVGRYLAWLRSTRGLEFADYHALWRWSTNDLPGFWSSIWEYFGVQAHTPYKRVLSGDSILDARWFAGATLNYAEQALMRTGSEFALVGRSQTRAPVCVTFDGLRDQVASVRRGLQRAGVRRGDRVVALMPNIPETVVAFLASVSLGAVWSSCSPEFGLRSVAERFAQLEPAVLLGVDGYRYGNKVVNRVSDLAALRKQLPTLKAAFLLPYLDPEPPRPQGWRPWRDLVQESAPLEFEILPFDHPLWVLFSSGTTGRPKGIVHSHGGITVEHLKALALQTDVGEGDRLFAVASTSWMVWNYLVSGLLVGASIVCFDGDPLYPDALVPWSTCAETGATYCALSAAYLIACRKSGAAPGIRLDLSRLKKIASTGSPLPPDAWRWVYQSVKSDVLLYSGSGGTDLCSGLVTGSPLLPVVAGEIACRCLGARVEALDADGRSLVDREGELVVTAPMPSMPLGFWNDPDRSRYRATYFEQYPGLWRHGDWITITKRGTCIIGGRSDATLNRSGVRLGTAEFYDVLEALPEIDDSVIVHLEDSDGGPGSLVLLIALAEGIRLDDALRKRIRDALRTQLSPRHVPDVVAAIPGIPRTLTGKRLEVPIKRILRGEDPDRVTSRAMITRPECLDAIVALRDELVRSVAS